MSGLSFQELAKTGQYKRASDLYRDLNKLYLFLGYPKSTNEEFAFHSAEELEDFILLVLKNKMYHFNKINRDNCNEEAKFLAARLALSAL